jgi:hypothetical protein
MEAESMKNGTIAAQGAAPLPEITILLQLARSPRRLSMEVTGRVGLTPLTSVFGISVFQKEKDLRILME